MVRRAFSLALLALVCAAILRSAAGDFAAASKVSATGAETVTREKTARRNEDKIWSGLVLATNVAKPKEPPAELREFATRMARIFGYNQFELVGSAAKPIDDDGETWLVPGKTLRLNVKGRRALSKEAQGGYLLNLQLFHEDRAIVDTEAKLAPGSPLFIRGPACGKGHLLIVLQVQR